MAKKGRRGSTLDEILHEIIVDNQEITVPQLAEELAVREGVLYEMANPNKPRRFPLALALPLMKATGDTQIVEHLAARMGLIVFRVRRRGKTRLENAADLLEYHDKFAEVLRNLIKAFQEGGQGCHLKIDKREALRSVDEFLSILAGLRDDIENMTDQLDLGLED